ncbi:MAG: protein-L-isoaspartate(D-aspartate) O-methyltransferase [Saprospiraceae bacterium]|nr:protein-L-isoaspartate(D-aspartate) O-methyltransferase [Bacteroidia bacterium]MBT8229058.1 protein-L-isoaspartate(D-aspartate) O-methyltransferase [Bacteroidia bacterium]NNF20768.1 protein-L-isoaspartate(D-aspartate) O-methyltransferase [Saprospiraceae bacterium]
MLDDFRHKGLRKKLVDTIKSKGIRNQKVLEAIGKIPRHLFLDKAFEEWAYKDQAFPIGHGQTISQPYTVAYQTELIDPQPDDKILEIGTGSGYQACVLALMCKKIYTIERQKSLFDKTNEFLQEIGFERIRTLFGDGYKGASRFAPFDKILVTAGADFIPEALLKQLKTGGILVIPLGKGEDKTMTRITRVSENKYETEEFGLFRFVPFMKGIKKN